MSLTGIEDMDKIILSKLTLKDARLMCQTSVYMNNLCQIIVTSQLNSIKRKVEKIIHYLDYNPLLLSTGYNDNQLKQYHQVLNDLNMDDYIDSDFDFFFVMFIEIRNEGEQYSCEFILDRFNQEYEIDDLRHNKITSFTCYKQQFEAFLTTIMYDDLIFAF